MNFIKLCVLLKWSSTKRPITANIGLKDVVAALDQPGFAFGLCIPLSCTTGGYESRTVQPIH